MAHPPHLSSCCALRHLLFVVEEFSQSIIHSLTMNELQKVKGLGDDLRKALENDDADDEASVDRIHDLLSRLEIGRASCRERV